MILLIDTAGNRERALAALLAQGIEPVEVLEREDLQLRHPLATWQRLRRVHPGRCYIFCRLIEAQFNRFPLKVLGALTGARTIHFCDERKLGPGMTPARILSRDFLLYLWHCAGALLAAFAFFVAYIALRLMVRSRKPALPQRSSAKRLCYIKTDFWRDLKAGGSVTHTREFINAGCALDYEIDVFACDPLIHYGLKPNVQVVEPVEGLYDLPILFSQMEYNLRFPLVVWKRLRGKPLDVIYQRHSSNNFSGVTLSVLLNAPFFLEHNSSSSWIAKNWSAQRSARIPRLCETLNLSGAYQIAVVSQALKQDLISVGVEPGKVVVNPNGVDPFRFGPHVDASAVRNTLPSGKLLVGFIGIFGQWHGVLTLMRCVKQVIKACNNAHFIIIGDGALKQQMLEILRNEQMTEHVTFVGLIKHDLAPAYLNACDVLVSPHEDMADGSTFFGSPTKIFEYMATGKGIVAGNVGQLTELLEGEQDALLVEQKNDRELAAAIVRLLRDAKLRQRLGEAARSKAVTNYTWEANFRRAIALRKTQLQLSAPKGQSELASRISQDEIA